MRFERWLLLGLLISGCASVPAGKSVESELSAKLSSGERQLQPA